MSGVKNLVQAESKGLEQVTNEDLREEGTGSASADASKDAKERE